jgi:MinD superfamily P-loop ATPase
MKELVIISGKGGTGKTLITASFSILKKDSVMADCDVDTPNLHLLLKPHIMSEEDYYGPKVAVLNKSKCIMCGKCMEKNLCRFHAIGKGEMPVFNSFYCRGCKVCTIVCPAGAITLEERRSGKIYKGYVEDMPVIYGQLSPGYLGSGKMVVQIKNIARNVALKEGKELIIIDSSAGLGCNVISALSNSDVALIVTEPTLSGISDLIRILDVTDYFQIPVSVCINKCGINRENEKKIADYCNEEGIKISGKLSFDMELAMNNKGQIPLISSPESNLSKELINLWHEVSLLLK